MEGSQLRPTSERPGELNCYDLDRPRGRRRPGSDEACVRVHGALLRDGRRARTVVLFGEADGERGTPGLASAGECTQVNAGGRLKRLAHFGHRMVLERLRIGDC